MKQFRAVKFQAVGLVFLKYQNKINGLKIKETLKNKNRFKGENNVAI